MMTVDIDKNSGFCAGVIRAISKAEEFLKDGAPDGGKRLFSSERMENPLRHMSRHIH